MTTPRPFRIIPCVEWGAKQPKRPITDAGKFDKALFHHTAGHHPNLDADSGESYAEAVAYAKTIQRVHMAPGGLGAPQGGIDTGNNFLVTRNGFIFEGRHRSVELLMRGHCPDSAHCPTQNDQPGVEIEHNGSEPMTPIQYEAAVWLFALICKKGGISPATIHGHKDYYATACPGVLYNKLGQFRVDVGKALVANNPVPGPKAVPYRVYQYLVKGTDGVKRWYTDVRPGK